MLVVATLEMQCTPKHTSRVHVAITGWSVEYTNATIRWAWCHSDRLAFTTNRCDQV